MNEKMLTRSNDCLIAGVAGGLANYLGIDPTIVRIVFALLALGGGHGFLIYIVLWFIMPAPTKEQAPSVDEIKVQDA